MRLAVIGLYLVDTVTHESYAGRMANRPLSATARAAAELADAADRDAVRAALVEASGAVRRAAEVLGISTATAHRRIAQFGLREWLSATYPRGERQPDRVDKSTVAR